MSTTPNKPLLKPRRLTTKQAKFVKAKIAGKTTVAAAMAAYPTVDYKSASVIGAQNLEKLSIQQALQEAYERQGLTVDALVRPLAEGLRANRVVQLEGDFYETEVPDHSTRIKAAGMAAQWIGLGKSEGGNNFNFINIAGGDSGHYGL